MYIEEEQKTPWPREKVQKVEQELLTLREHLSSHLLFSGVRVTRSLVLYVCFVERFNDIL
jgi:hypothetical protein